jgi:copper chaperone
MLKEELMAEATLKIEGMSCQHCVMRVKKAVDSVSGVSQSDVKVGAATITFDEAKVKRDEIEKAVVKAGYTVSGK